MKRKFLSNESMKIIDKMTSTPFGIEDKYWLYWLFKLEMIPGGWDAEFYLETNEKKEVDWFLERELGWIYSGWGLPDKAVKKAYSLIDKKWLREGSKRGKKFWKEFHSKRKRKDEIN